MPGKEGVGFLVLIIKFCPSALISAYWKMDWARLESLKVLSKDSLAISAVSLSPLENLTLSLIWKVQVSLSSEIDHLSANQGVAFILLSNFTKHSPKP